MREWFNNTGIATRLAALVCVALLAVMVTAFSGMNSNRLLAENTDFAYQAITRPLAAVADARGAFNAMRTALYDLAQDFNTSRQNAAFKHQIMQNLVEYEQNILLYKTILDKYGTSDPYEEEAVRYLFEQLWPLRCAVEHIASVSERTGRGADAIRMLRGSFLNAAEDVSSELLVLTKILEAQNSGANRYAERLEHRNHMLALGALCASALFLLFIAYITVRSITQPMREMRSVAEDLADGRLDVRINYRSRNEIGILADSFRDLTRSITSIINDMQAMARQQSGGDIEYFIDLSPYRGSYRNMANGINTMMRTALDDVGTIVRYLAALADGNFDMRVESFPGKKAVISDYLGDVYDNLRAAFFEIETSVKHAANGRLGVRVDAERYAGDWRALMEEFNLLLHTLRRPINEAALVLSRIAEGDFTARVSGEYKGDIALIKEAVNATAVGLAAYLQAKLEAERLAYESERAKDRAEAAHKAVVSGITYASKIQNSLRPTERQFAEAFTDYAIIWEPRDIVGGDIYWMKRFGAETVLCVCDCTGHGTPGALLTMLVVSALDSLVDAVNCRALDALLWQLDIRLADTLNVCKTPSASCKSVLSINDGCDLALIHVAADGTVVVASSNISVFVCNGSEVRHIKGQKFQVGDGKITDRSDVRMTTVPADPVNAFYVASDGLYDQIGGECARPFGYAAVKRLMLEHHTRGQAYVSSSIWEAFESYRGAQPRRDDVQLISFKPNTGRV